MKKLGLSFDPYKNIKSCHEKSLIESFHPIAVLGQVGGFFPIKNVLVRRTSTKNYEFSLFTSPVLWSVVLNLTIYCISFEATCDYWVKRPNLFKFSTDAFAIQIFLAVFILLRFTLHILSIFRAPKVLECLQKLESYDKFYKLKNQSTLFNRHLFIYLVGTALNVAGNVVASYPEVARTIKQNFYHGQRKYLIFYIVPSPEFLSVLCYGIHLVAEVALFFSHCCIGFIITAICDRIGEIKWKILEISKNKNFSLHELLSWRYFQSVSVADLEKNSSVVEPLATFIDHWPSFSKEDLKMCTMPVPTSYFHYETKEKFGNVSVFLAKTQNSNGHISENDRNEDDETNVEDTQDRIRNLCSQYMSLVDINLLLNDFAKETVAVFTAGSAVMLVALCYLIAILLTQYVPVQESRINEKSEILPLAFIAVITFLRMMNFINIGEKLRCDGNELAKAVHQIYSSDPKASPIILHFQRIVSKLTLNLSAGGFFTVQRTVITSILGPIVTFIVILAQFRAADLQLHYNNPNGTLN